MSNIQVFGFGSSNVRTIIDAQGEPWFVAGDVAAILGYSETSKMLRNVDDLDCKLLSSFTSPWQGDVNDIHSLHQSTKAISESGLYDAVLSSILPEAKAFRRWVTSEVLPSIRKTGRYETPTALTMISADLQAADVAMRFMKTAHETAQALGLKENFAILAADQATRKLTENRYSPVALLGMQLIEERKEVILTPTEIGMRLEPQISAIKVNQRLAERGFQIKPVGVQKWEPTEPGKEFAELIATGKSNSNGSPIIQLKWRESIVERLK